MRMISEKEVHTKWRMEHTGVLIRRSHTGVVGTEKPRECGHRSEGRSIAD